MFPAVPLSFIKLIKQRCMHDKSFTVLNIPLAKVSLRCLSICNKLNALIILILGLIVKLSSELKNFPADAVMQQSFFNNSNDINFCSVSLPSPQPLASTTASCAQRCFIVCSPHSLPTHVLKKVFCRFGNLIDVYLLNNRNCGYVKFATVESARQVNFFIL